MSLDTLNCKCGTKVKYDCDGCGHEWLTCIKCKIEIEGYELSEIDLINVWENKMNEHSVSQNKNTKSNEIQGVNFQAVRDEEIRYFMPSGFGTQIDSNVKLQRKQLLKSINDKNNGYWTGHTAFRTLVALGLVEDTPDSKLTVRGKIFLQQGMQCQTQMSA